MKKLVLFSLFFCFAFTVSAEVYTFNANSYSYKARNGSTWTDWTKWENVENVSIVINDKTKRITFLTPEKHELEIYEISEFNPSDDEGKVKVFNCVNKEHARCQIRVRLDASESTPLFIDLTNVMFVYNVVKQ